MSAHDDGGPAFPQGGVWDGDRNQVNPVGFYFDAGGMSLRAYAAIELRVPESGIDWLDDMIRRAKRHEIAATISINENDLPSTIEGAAKLVGMGVDVYVAGRGAHWPKVIAATRLEIADAMLAERAKVGRS